MLNSKSVQDLTIAEARELVARAKEAEQAMCGLNPEPNKFAASDDDYEASGLGSLLGKRVLLMCAAYFYHGTLVEVGLGFAKLDDCAIVYDTGAWDAKTLADAQRIGDGHYVMTQAIESFREETRR